MGTKTRKQEKEKREVAEFRKERKVNEIISGMETKLQGHKSE